MAILVTLSSPSNGSLTGSWNAGNCISLDFYGVNLYKDNVIYNATTQTQTSKSWSSMPSGTYYLTIIGNHNGGICDSGTSSSIILNTTTFCIPSDATNISMKKLAIFYGLTTSNILLSGPNNPSTSGSIFGQTDLPNTGTNSKSRPNAISELRGACGGVQTWNFFEHILGSGGSSSIACGAARNTTYYSDNSDLKLSTSLWTNSSLTTKVTTANWYSNGSVWIYVNSSGNVTSSGNCAF